MHASDAMRAVRWAVGVGLALASMAAARADSWLPPCPEVHASPGGGYRFIIVPSARIDAGSCPSEVQEVDLSGRPRAADFATGTLERREGTAWVTVWQRELTHRVSPTSVAVSDTGRVATFDNWHAVGWGDNVVVLYDQQGRLVRQMGLADFLPRFYVHALPRSVSSIWWGGRHAFTVDGRALVLNVVVPAPDPEGLASAAERPQMVQLEVDADTGRVTPPAGPAWEQALVQARHADAALCADEVAMFRRHLAPLASPPPLASTADWRSYGYGVLRRLRPAAAPELPSEICALSAADFAERRSAVATCLSEVVEAAADTPQEVVLLAPDPAALWSAVQPALAGLRPGALAGSRLYLAALPAARDHLGRSLAPLGAAVTWFDPAEPLALPASARAELLARFDPRDGRGEMGVCGPEARPDAPQ